MPTQDEKLGMVKKYGKYFGPEGEAAAMAAGAAQNMKGSPSNSKAPTSIASKSSATAWMVLLLAVGLWFSDLYITKFNGINLKFGDFSIADALTKSAFFGILLVMVFMQYISRAKRSRDEWTWIIALDALVALVFAIGSYHPGVQFHLIFALILYFVAIKPGAGASSEQKASAYKTIFILMVIDFIGFQWFAQLLQWGNFGTIASIIGNKFILPIYILFILGYLSSKLKSTLAAVMLLLILIGYVGMLVTESQTFQDTIQGVSLAQERETLSTLEAMKKGISAFFSTILDPFACITSVAEGEYNKCIKERAAERKCSDYEKGTPEFVQCKNLETGIQVEGKVVDELTSTKISFKKPSKIFPDTVKEGSFEDIPYDVEITSNERTVTVEFSCKFKKDGKIIPGSIYPNSRNAVQVLGEDTVDIYCRPAEAFKKGTYTVIFEATAKNVETISFLDKIFIEKRLETKEGEDRLSDILSERSLDEIEEVKTGDELSTFWFRVGTDKTAVYAGDEPTIVIRGNPKNLKTLKKDKSGSGSIVKVHSVDMDLRYLDIIPDQRCEEQGFDYNEGYMTWRGEGFPSLSCELIILDNLRFLGQEFQREEFVPVQFKSYMNYDYKLTKEETFEVKAVPTNT